jgi:hypothetical protein
MADRPESPPRASLAIKDLGEKVSQGQKERSEVTRKRRRNPCWYDVGEAVKLLIGLADGIAQLIRSIHGG